MTTYELAGYLARRMVAEGYSEADAIDAEAMLLRHFAACRKRERLLTEDQYVSFITQSLSADSPVGYHNFIPSTSEAGE